MSRYSQRVDALENNEKKKRRIFTAIIIILVLLFLGGMAVGAKQILGTEGTYDPYAETAVKPFAVDGTPQELLDMLAVALGSASDPDRVRLSVYTDIDIPDDSIAVASGDESLETELKYIKPDILGAVKEYYEIYEGKFGEDFSGKVIPAAFSADEIGKVECVRGRLADDGALTDTEKLFYTVEFPEVPFEEVESSLLFGNFGMDISETVRNTFVEDISEIAAVNSVNINCDGFRITAQTDAKTGLINNISYVRGYSVGISLTFRGDLSELGEQEISFVFTATESHWYTWAGLALSEHALSIEKGDIQALEAFRTADDEVELTWTSSAPEIAEVDSMGYVKGKAESAQPVMITASFDYRGGTYTDSCVVYVRKPVTEITVSPKELELSRGDTAQLETEIKPKKATIKDVLWFTEDEKVATVDKSGTITAVGTGTTKVFAISADGYYRSSCVVTVAERRN